MAQNLFDQFDAPASGANIFDQFDEGAKDSGGFASDIGKSLKVGVQELPGMATGLADLPFALATGARPFTKAADVLGEATGFQPGKWAKDTKFSAGYEQGKANIDKAWEGGSAGDIALEYLKNPGYTAQQVVQSVPGMVAGGFGSKLALGAGRIAAPLAKAGGVGPSAPGLLARTVGEKWAVPLAAGAGEGAVTAGQQMAQYQGDDQQKNALAALAAGAGTAAIGVGAGRLANALGLETAETAIAKIGSKAAGAADEIPLSAKQRILGGIVSEAVLQEMPQSAQEQMWQNYADGKPVMEGVTRATVEGGLAGGVMGGVANVRGQNTEARGPVPEQAPGIPPESPPGTAPTQDEPFAPAEPTIEGGPDGVARTAADRNAGTQDIPNGDPTDVTPAPPEQRIAQLEERLAFVQQQAQANGWDQRLIGARDEATAELDALRIKPVDIGALDIQLSSTEAPSAGEYYAPGDTTNPLTGERIPDQRTPSQRMGIDPVAGPNSKAAALAVDSGASDQMQAQALAEQASIATKSGASNQGQANERPSNQPSAGLLPLGGPAGNDAGRGVGTAGAVPRDAGRRDAGASLSSLASNGKLGSAPAGQRGNGNAPLTAPANLRDGLARIRAQRQEAVNAQAAQAPAPAAAPAPVPTGAAAVEAAGSAPVSPTTTGVTSEPQTAQAQQSIAQPTQAGGTATAGPAAAATAGQSATVGGSGVQADGVKPSREVADAAGIATSVLGEDMAAKNRFADFADAHAGKPAGEVQSLLAASEFGPKLAGNELAQISDQISKSGSGVASQARANAAPQVEASDSQKLANKIKFQKIRVEQAGAAVASAQDVDQFGLPIENGPKKQAAKARLQKAEADLAALESTQPQGAPAEGAGAVEAAGLTENKVGRKDSAQIAQPESVVGDTSSPWASMTPDQRRRTRLEQEIATGMTNNGGVMAKLRPSAIEKRKQELAAMPPKEAAGAAPNSGVESANSGVIPAVPAAPAPANRHPNWRKNAIQAGRVARELGLEPKGKRLAQIVAEVDAKDARGPVPDQNQPAPSDKPVEPVRLGRNQTPLSEGGKPFATKAAATDAKKQQPMMRVVKVKGGFALADKTPAQLAAEAKAAKRLSRASTSAAGEPIPAHAFIAGAGGLSQDVRSDLGVDGNPRIGNRTLFAGRGRGMSIEDATNQLIEDGYLSEGASHNDAYALIKKSLSQPQYNADGIERIAEAESAAQFEDYLASEQEAADDSDFDPFVSDGTNGFIDDDFDASGYAAASDPIKTEVRALVAQANALGIDTDAILEQAHEDTRNESEQAYYERARTELTRVISESTGGRSNQEANGNAQGKAGQDAGREIGGDSRQADGAQGASVAAGAREGFDLAAPSRADVVARQNEQEAAAKQKAKDEAKAEQDAKKERDRKDIASRMDASAENFALGQDANDSLSGQGAMFSRARVGAQSANDQSAANPRRWYDRLVSLLPDAYRGDSYRREPLPSKAGDAHASAELRDKIEALNKQLRGENDRKGYGPVSADDLGNLQFESADVSTEDIVGPIKALADELGYGIAATGVSKAQAQALIDAGFTPEIGLGAVADRLTGRIPVMPNNAYAVSRPGSIFSYKPRGFPMVLFSRNQPIARADSNAQNVATQMLVDGLKEKWTRAPEIIVARNMQDAQIPQEVRDYDAELKSQGSDGDARGFIYKGKVYLLSDQLKGPEQIAEVLFHEVLGHYGLRGTFGEGLTPILQQLGTMRRRDVLAKAREYGMVKKSLSDADAWAAMSAKDRLSAAEEVLAEMAQTQPTIGFVKRAIALIRNWLRANVPGFKSLLLTDSDIIQAYIIPARGFVTRSNETPKQSIERAMMAFSRVWHGSPHKFLQFDSSKIGTGEGAQAYGHGIYLAESQAVSKGYMQSNPLGMDVGQEAAKRGINLSAGARGELVRQARANADPKVAARRLQNANSSTRDIDTNSLSEVISEYQKSLDGNLYQVDLPDDQIAKMLDWDKPLSEQPPEVQKALASIANGKMTGEQAWKAAIRESGNPLSSIAKKTGQIFSTPQEAADNLQRLGIPGIRYLDGGSRGNGAGTSNYVIFPGMEKILTIIDVNGEPVTGAEKAKVLGEQMDMAFSRDTNEAMTNKDVVGNTQGGRSADDTTPGTDENTGLPLNADGTVTVYHHTSAVGAEAIRKSGKLKAEAEPDVYVTTRRETDTGYGDTAVPIRVRPDQLSIDDEFPDGRKDFRLNVGKPGGSINVTVANESTAPDSGGAAFSRTAGDQTQTEAFKKWFAGSRVVDADGKPLVMYHGTDADFSEFDIGKSRAGIFGAGFYFTPNTVWASALADKSASGANVMPVYLSLKNPVTIEAGEYEQALLDKFPKAETADQLTTAMIEAGYDGLIRYGKNGIAEVLVFRGTQIKSAIGNSGTFGPASPDIRFSRTSTATGTQSAWDAPLPSSFDDIVYKMQDKHIDTRRVVDAITAKVGQIKDAVNVYLQEELFHGRAAKRVADFGAMELKPVLNQMRMAGLSLDDVEEFLHARHAKEANALIAQREPGMPDGGSGMTNQAADDYMKSLTADQKRRLEAVASKVDAIIGKTRQMYADYGLEDQKTVDGWGTMFANYVPLMREGKDGGMMGIGQGFTVKGKEVKGRTGSTRKVVNILANIAAQREKVIVRGEKNRVATALVGLAAANPNKEFWETRSQPPTERVYDAKSDSVVDRPDSMFKQRPNVVTAKVKDSKGNVTEQSVVFNEDDPRAMRMAAALKNLDAGQLEGLLGVSAKITRYFSAINTQYNPVFGVVNLVRDVQGAMVNLGSTELAGQQAKIAKNTLPALAGIYKDVRAARQGKQPTSKWSALWDQMQEDGGTTGYRDLFSTTADRANNLKNIIDPNAWADGKWGKVFTANGKLKVPLSIAKQKAGVLFDWLSDYNEAMENGVRLAAYSAALDNGMTRAQAASLSKNLTVNFNRKGQVGQQAGALYAFFNAAMQGTARIGQALFEMDGGDYKTIRLSSTGKKVIAGGLALGSIQAMMLAAAGFGDDEPPDFVRERSLVIPTGGKGYISIPMPLGLHVIPGLGRHATEFALNGFKDPAKRAISIFGMLADAFNPIGNAGLSMQTLAPTALDPLVALTENKDWTGKPIARTSSNKAVPGHSQWKDTASSPAKWISEAINTMSGGDKYVAGALSPTPDQIDYLFAQVAGGVGRELAKVEQTAGSFIKGEELPTYKVPLVGRFYGNAGSQASEGTAFYASVNKLNEIETKAKAMRKDGKFNEAAEYLRSQPDAPLILRANAAERQIQKLKRDKRDLIEKGADREQVRAKEEQITAVMANMNRAVEARRALAKQ